MLISESASAVPMSSASLISVIPTGVLETKTGTFGAVESSIYTTLVDEHSDTFPARSVICPQYSLLVSSTAGTVILKFKVAALLAVPDATCVVQESSV